MLAFMVLPPLHNSSRMLAADYRATASRVERFTASQAVDLPTRQQFTETVRLLRNLADAVRLPH
jgi:hypothetical protein